MSERKRDSLMMQNPKVGVLFNLPTKPVRGEDVDYVAEAEVEDQVEDVQEALRKIGLQYQLFILKDDVEGLIRELKSYRPDVIVNLCEGAFGDSHQEMNIPSLLELLRIPYTGSPPLTVGLSQNKGVAKDILKANRIPTPKYRVLNGFEDWKGGLDYPLFVKPLREDASLGISRENFVRSDAELGKRVNYIVKCYGQPALVEEYVAGRELNVAVLGNKKPRVLPISEIVFEFPDEPKIVDYSAKWFPESDEYKMTKPVCPANLTPSIKHRVERVALRAYEALHCRDYARVDMRLKDDVPFVLEVNANPDLSHEAGFARSLKAARISFEDFIKDIVFFALERKT